MKRPDRDEWHLEGARWLAQMGDCTRRKVGALIVGPDKRFWGMGYNGSYPGGPSCLEGACPRGRHYEARPGRERDGDLASHTENLNYYGDDWGLANRFLSQAREDVRESPCEETLRRLAAVQEVVTGSPDICACGNAWPCPDAVAPGSAYDTGPGACIASHAEANAVSDAQRRGHGTLPDATLYVSCEPCEGCVRHIRNTTQIAAIRWPEGVIGLP